MKQVLSHWYRGVALASAVIAGATGCHHVDHVALLNRMPEAALRYPGATLVETMSHTPGPNPMGGGRSGATIQVRETVRASAPDILAYFADMLTPRDWTRVDDGPSLGYFVSEVWRKPHRAFVIDLAHGKNGLTEIRTTLAERDD